MSTLAPLPRTRLTDDIVALFKNRIVGGDWAPGDKLPAERELALQLGVNRSTVREALQTLESIGLVEVRHGSGIYARDFLESGSLELARHMLVRDGGVDPKVMGDLLELRALLVPEVSYRAAQHRTAADVAALTRLVRETPDMPIDERDRRIHQLLARAAGNLLFVILLNAFTEMTQGFAQAYWAKEANRRRSAKFHRDILAAVAAGDAPKAKRVMADVLRYAEADARAALDSFPIPSRKTL